VPDPQHRPLEGVIHIAAENLPVISSIIIIIIPPKAMPKLGNAGQVDVLLSGILPSWPIDGVSSPVSHTQPSCAAWE
jgi:hypothetical protein